ncbi:MAG TPA: SRPBCC family protein [Candidatus Thermoplasmatota archaeon]|nr:SRPBCC family protein [Candidatus Thermoplasmatota archaeon]
MPATRIQPEYYVDADVAKAETLPASAFTDPAVLSREFETVFRDSWLLVPQRTASELRDDPRSLAELVRRRGARTPVSVADRPLFLQRDWGGMLRAFPNVCTHAWHTLVAGPERDRAIVCPQHGRRFDMAGKFLSQAGFEGVKGFPRDCDSLETFPALEWADLLFVALGKPTIDAKRFLAPITDSLGTLPLDRLKRQPVAGEVREVAGNWKQHAWNYMDSLHIPYIHSRPGGLSEAIGLESYRTELHGHASLQWAYAKDPAHGFDPALLPKRYRSGNKRVFALWWLLFPNLTLNFYPWGLSVNAYMPVPNNPQKTLFLWYQWSWDDKKYEKRNEVWQIGAVDDEDVDALTQVARGVRSGFAPRGRFAPKREAGPHWFHRRVYESVFGGGSPPKQKLPA